MNDNPIQPSDRDPHTTGAWWAAGNGNASQQPAYSSSPYEYQPYGYPTAASSTPVGTATATLPPVFLPPPSEPEAPVVSGPQRTSWFRRSAAAGVLAVVALASGTAGAAISQTFDDDPAAATVAAAPLNIDTTSAQTAPTQSLAQVAAKVTPSVVSIQVASQSGAGQGSGVVLTETGQIITNNHVVAAAANGGEITVRFSDGSSAKAQILGRDPSTDLAVIQAQGVSGLTPATIGSSSSLHVGDTVLAVGNPLGLEGSVSAGIVSALQRSVDIPSEEQQQTNPFGGQSQSSGTTVLKNAIQTDAAVNPGNSGGALVDAAGRLVGINSAIATLSSGSGQSGSIGLGFAIPIDTARTIATQLAQGETVQHPRLGVSIGDSTTGSAGAEIGAVTAGSGAAWAGLQQGDVITSIDDAAVQDAESLQAVIATHQPGETVTVTYTRSGSERTAQVTLGAAN